jgi:hypothetical protein
MTAPRQTAADILRGRRAGNRKAMAAPPSANGQYQGDHTLGGQGEPSAATADRGDGAGAPVPAFAPTPMLTPSRAAELALAGAGDVPDWPAPPDEAVYRGLAGEVVDRIDPETEADRVAVLMHFLVFFGSAAGRCAYRPVGGVHHHTNLYCCLVGASSKGRKGTARGWAEMLVAGADSAWAERAVVNGLSSGEGLISPLQDSDGDGDPHKRLCVVEEEFASVLRVAARDGNTLSAVVRQAWDGRRLSTMTRKNPLRADNVHVSIFGHITRKELLGCLTEQDASNGFANRFLWAAVRRSKKKPDGGESLDLRDLSARVRDRLEDAWTRGLVRRDDAAMTLWHQVYDRLWAERPGVYGNITARAEAQVLRLSVLYTLLDGAALMQRRHVESAVALWDYCDRSCQWVFGTGTGSDIADEILTALEECPAGLTLTEISGVFGRHRSAAQLKQALGVLKAGRLAADEKRPTAGRFAEVWKAAKYAKKEQEGSGKP